MSFAELTVTKGKLDSSKSTATESLSVFDGFLSKQQLVIASENPDCPPIAINRVLIRFHSSDQCENVAEFVM